MASSHIKEKITKHGNGFTLMQLLVLMAIVGVLASIAMVRLNSSRSRGNATAVKGNLSNIPAQMKIYFEDNTGYGKPLLAAPCPTATESGTAFAQNYIMNLINSASQAGNNKPICAAGGDKDVATSWAVSLGFRDNRYSGDWCVDSSGHDAPGIASGGGKSEAKCK